MKRFKVLLTSCAAALMGAAWLAPATAAPAPTPAAAAPDRAELLHKMQRRIQRLVDKQPRLDGQAERFTVRVSIDPKNAKRVLVDLGRGYIPSNYGGDFEDAVSLVYTEAYEMIQGVPGLTEVDMRFDGYSSYKYFPDEAPRGK